MLIRDAAASCTGGSQSGEALCNGSDRTCPAPTVADCAPFACGVTACRTSCTLKSHCQGGRYCNASNQCVPELTQGSVCDDDGQCASGACTDGVCCNAACDGQCEACAQSGSAGSCIAVSGAPVGSRAACTDDGCGCTAPGAGTGSDAGWAALGLLGLAALRSRRRTRR